MTKHPLKTLGELCNIQMGRTPPRNKPECWKGENLWAKIEDLNDGILTDTNEKVTDLAKGLLSPPADFGTLLFSFKLTIGKMAFVSQKTYFNEAIVALQSKSENCLDIKYLFYVLKTLNWKNQTDQAVRGITLNKKKIQNIQIPLPPIDEQQENIKFLSAVDDKLKALRQKQMLMEKYKSGLMRKIFNQELRFTRNDGNNYSDWSLKRIDEITKIVGGGTPLTEVHEYWNGGIVWFTPTEVKQKYLGSSLRTITTKGLKHSSAEIVPPGALLFTSRATIGDIGIATMECCTNQGFKSFLVNRKCNNEFLYYWILNNKRNFLRKASGSTYLEISKHEIKKLRICLPCVEEQQKIVGFLSTIDLKIDQIRNQIKLFEKFKKGLMQQLFV